MIVARTRAELDAALPVSGRRALVPTMGYLHDGHYALVDLARGQAEHVVVSIFVNPLQFGPAEDFDAYPRDERRDLQGLEARGVDVAFLPGDDEMYPDGRPSVRVTPGPAGDVLCGAARPGHFEGVLTVVAKLFGIVRPAVAVFGRKDYQQLVLIRRMCRDLDFRVDVVGGAIVRESDGLAMSSRNRYLDERERADAARIHEGLKAARDRFARGERDLEALRGEVVRCVAAGGSLRLEYAALVDPDTLAPVTRATPETVLAVAARCGRARLIDNETLG